jgi:hypothetical protein
MLNNLKQAQPQHGQNRADVLYEVCAEGGITRMVGLYLNPSAVPKLGAVRSTRSYYLDIAQGHDAFLFHAGASEMAYDDIKTRGVDNMDGTNGPSVFASLYYRDKARRAAGYSLEHTLFIDGEDMEKAIGEAEERGIYRTELREGYELGWRFDNRAAVRNGKPAKTISVKFSRYKTGLFEYDAQQDCYLVSQYGKPYTDGETEEQVKRGNVLTLFAEIGLIKGDAYGRLYADLVGEGEGFYASGGQYCAIRWTKAAYDEPFAFWNTDGTPLTMRPGTGYINIVENGAEVVFS